MNKTMKLSIEQAKEKAKKFIDVQGIDRVIVERKFGTLKLSRPYKTKDIVD